MIVKVCNFLQNNNKILNLTSHEHLLQERTRVSAEC